VVEQNRQGGATRRVLRADEVVGRQVMRNDTPRDCQRTERRRDGLVAEGAHRGRTGDRRADQDQ
jgi:hypothetical protein